MKPGNKYMKGILGPIFAAGMLLTETAAAYASFSDAEPDKPYDTAVIEKLSQVEEYSFAQNCFNEDRVIKSVNSQSVYTGNKLEWKYCSDTYFDVLTEVERDDLIAEYEYNDKYQRVSKTVNGETIYFEYDEWGNIIREYYDNKEVIYLYEELKPCGFVYEGEEYRYKTEDGLIVGIIYGEDLIAEYTYSEGVLDGVYELSEGSAVLNSDKDFIANINKIRYSGWYCDDETGWNYSGRYFDPKNDRFIDGKSREEMEPFIERYGYTAEIITQINDFYSENEASAYALVPSKDTQIKTIATVIFGESYDNVIDQLGVAQVIQNRMHSSNPAVLYGGTTAYEIVTAKNAFAAYGVFTYEEMMKHSATQLASQAMENARRLYADISLVYHLNCYDGCTFFCSVRSAYESITYKDGSLYKDGKKLKRVYLSNYGEITGTVQLRVAYGNGQPGNNEYYGKNNVFYQRADL
ncbi:MAG: cell wall hydrolase [Butyrivibrio sp.]|nr:cell wall hydrolase [Butyrivibrio sp.]